MLTFPKYSVHETPLGSYVVSVLGDEFLVRDGNVYRLGAEVHGAVAAFVLRLVRK